MSEVYPTTSAKPSKPYPDFPLYAHTTGRWAKKIRGKLYYFGPWSDPDGALAKYLAEKDYLHAGRKPQQASTGVTVKEAANAFLNHKQDLLASGELSPRTWLKYKQVTDLVVSHFGKARAVDDLGPDDFASLRRQMTKQWGALRVRDFIQQVRSIFKHALDARLISRPIHFGPGFARPSKKTLRLERAKKGPRMFEAEELRRILEAVTMPMRAMILLGINAGLGNADIGLLRGPHLDLERAWLNYPRPKTGIPRRCPLWPETVAALREVLANRPEPKDQADGDLVFITQRGLSWHKKTEDNPISKEMRKLLDSLHIDGHRNFYALRHTFETIGGEARDQVAVDAIMGHARDDMASVYRERISDDRLKAVTDLVRAWLYG
jgi:integrase